MELKDAIEILGETEENLSYYRDQEASPVEEYMEYLEDSITKLEHEIKVKNYNMLEILEWFNNNSRRLSETKCVELGNLVVNLRDNKEP